MAIFRALAIIVNKLAIICKALKLGLAGMFLFIGLKLIIHDLSDDGLRAFLVLASELTRNGKALDAVWSRIERAE
jgi:hypothetical protein